MATADLQSFLEDRLRALDPSIDLDPGSPAQIEFIAPVLTRLGTDPFETDVLTFITDRFAQEFPDLYSGDPQVINDVFVKPLRILLDPFKREINTIKQNQSFIDPSLLSDDDANALAANTFSTRNAGGFATGVVRIFFPNPTNQSVEITSRAFTANSLSYFPTAPTSITAEEMVFNRDGALYYMDVSVKAEKAGTEYNIDVGTMTGIDGVFGAIKVTNPRKFTGGTTVVGTETFIAQARESLNERSLVTRRGATARISEVFAGDVQAIQVIGAKDPEMQRDLLKGTSKGQQWVTGRVSLYNNVAFVQARTVDGDLADAPVPGDQLYVYLDPYAYGGRWSGLDQGSRFVRLTVDKLIFGPLTSTLTPYIASYFVQWSGEFPTGITLPPSPAVLEGGFSRKGVITISELPDGVATSLTVGDSAVHVYGHTDVYVRPVLQPVSKAVLGGVYDLGKLGNTATQPSFYIERTTLSTTAGSNAVFDTGFDFVEAGVEIGDALVIEDGDDSGSYTIGKVTSADLYLISNLTKSVSSGRYRIHKKIRINPFDPRIPKFPFGSALADDLSTTIGSNLLKLVSNDMLSYGVKVGDTVRITSGLDAGDYVIQSFDATLGGKGLVVNKSMTSTNPGLTYEVFTKLAPVEKPLVRVRQIGLLDSAQQATGITIPPADPVGIVPVGNFSAAQVKGSSARATGVVLPNMTGLISSTNTKAAPVGGDQRFSLGFEPFTGVFRDSVFANGAHAEFNIPADAFTSCSWFTAVVEDSSQNENFPPIDPQPGDALAIKTGPNSGSYTIEKVYKFRHQDSTGKKFWTYFTKIYGEFPVDILTQVFTFLNKAKTDGAAISGIVSIADGVTLTYPDVFTGVYNGLGAQLSTAFAFYGVSSAPSSSTIQSTVASVAQVEYEWGEPARGVLRTYFTEPTLFEQWTDVANVATTYSYTPPVGDVIKFRPEPGRYSRYQLIPARLDSDTDPTDLPRDLDASVAGTATFTDTTKPTAFVAEIQSGDVLEVHEEITFHGWDKTKQEAVATVAGSNRIMALGNSSPFDQTMEGNLLFLEEGVDTGGFKVIQYVDANTLLLDKVLTYSTPAVLRSGSAGNWGYQSTQSILSDSSIDFTPYVGKYLTIYGIDYTHEGSWQIASVTGGAAVLTGNPFSSLGFPVTTDAKWVITEAPTTAPAAVRSGTELVGGVPIRMYRSQAAEFTVGTVSSSISTSSFSVTGVQNGFSQPYRIYRPNVRRVTPTEINANKEGSLFYFDTEVISLNPQSAANIPAGTYLTLDDSTYASEGYKHIVNDQNFTYSMQEDGFLDLPLKMLPVGVEDSTTNYISLSGVPVEIDYEQADIVKQLQLFLDSAQDRVTVANMLARHFLPTYVSYDATYTGGSAASVIAKDIINYINTLSIETPIDVSDLENLILRRGGNPNTPTEVVAVIHDWDRKVWMEKNENKLGGTSTLVPYSGSPRVSFFVAGPDVSGQSDLSLGERINLTKD
jgi:hypothetical protein